jgi:hypothetical protein
LRQVMMAFRNPKSSNHSRPRKTHWLWLAIVKTLIRPLINLRKPLPHVEGAKLRLGNQPKRFFTLVKKLPHRRKSKRYFPYTRRRAFTTWNTHVFGSKLCWCSSTAPYWAS